MDNIDPEKLKELLSNNMEDDKTSQDKSEHVNERRDRGPIGSTGRRTEDNDEKAATPRTRPVIRRRVFQREPIKKEEAHTEEHNDKGKGESSKDNEPQVTEEPKKTSEEHKDLGKPEIRTRASVHSNDRRGEASKPVIGALPSFPEDKNGDEHSKPEVLVRPMPHGDNQQEGDRPKPEIRTRPSLREDKKEEDERPKPEIRTRPNLREDKKEKDERPKPEIRTRPNLREDKKEEDERPKPEIRTRPSLREDKEEEGERPKPEIRGKSISPEERGHPESDVQIKSTSHGDETKTGTKDDILREDSKSSTEDITISDLAKLLGRSNIMNHPLGSKGDLENDPEKLPKLKAILEEQLNNQIQRKLITERQYLHERIEYLQKSNTDCSNEVKKCQALLEEKDNAINKINQEIKDLASKHERERNDSEMQFEERYKYLEEQRQKEIDNVHELVEKLVTNKEDIDKAHQHHEIHQQILVLVNAIAEERDQLGREKNRWEAAANKTADILETWQFAYKDICPNDSYLKHILGNKAVEELEYVEERTKNLKELFSKEEYQNLLGIKKRQHLLNLQLKNMMGYNLEDIVKTVNQVGQDEDSYVVNDKRISREIAELAMKCYNVREETNKYLKKLEDTHYDKT